MRFCLLWLLLLTSLPFAAMAVNPPSYPERELHAGPVTVKLADGELRYLSVGGEEIVRRIYFCVRDSDWDTAAPHFDRYDVKQEQDSFHVELEARCTNGNADFTWKGTITGSKTGEIVFSVQGEAMKEFHSPRIGICMLYGSQAVAGQKFEVSKGGKAGPGGGFPVDIAHGAVANDFDTLSYTSKAGVKVSCRLEDGIFGMEDQRNFGDSSYKAYAGLAYPYPNVPEHVLEKQKLTISVLGAGNEATEAQDVVHVSPASGEGSIPHIEVTPSGEKPADYLSLNSNTDFSKMEHVALGYNPSLHLRDDDTFVENIPTIGDQVRTIRKLMPKALPFWFGPIEFNSPHPRPMADPRNETAFGAAWCAAVVGELGAASVERAAFKVDGDPAREMLQELGKLEGMRVTPYKVEASPGVHVAAFAVATKEGPRLWLVNLSADFREIQIDGEKGTERLGPWEVKNLKLKHNAPKGQPAATPRPLPRRPNAH